MAHFYCWLVVLALGVCVHGDSLSSWRPISDPCNRSTTPNAYTKQWDTTHGGVLCDTYHTIETGLTQPHFLVMYHGTDTYTLAPVGDKVLDSTVYLVDARSPVVLQYETRDGMLLQNPYRYSTPHAPENFAMEFVRQFDPCPIATWKKSSKFVYTYYREDEASGTCVDYNSISRYFDVVVYFTFEIGQVNNQTVVRVRYEDKVLEAPFGEPGKLPDGTHIVAFQFIAQAIHHWEQRFVPDGSWMITSTLYSNIYARASIKIHTRLWSDVSGGKQYTAVGPWAEIGSVPLMVTTTDINPVISDEFFPISYAAAECCDTGDPKLAIWRVLTKWASDPVNVTKLGPVAMAVGDLTFSTWKSAPKELFFDPTKIHTPPSTGTLLQGAMGQALDAVTAKFDAATGTPGCQYTCDAGSGCVGHVNTRVFAPYQCYLGKGIWEFSTAPSPHYPVPFTGNFSTWRKLIILSTQQLCDVLTTDVSPDWALPRVAIATGSNMTYNPCEPVWRGCDGSLWGPRYDTHGHCG